MRAWIVIVAAVALASVGASGALADASEDENVGLFVGITHEGEILVQEHAPAASPDLDRQEGSCVFDVVENACSTGSYDAPVGLVHGFSFPTGTVFGDFQSNLIGEDGSTHQWQCTYTFVDGEPAPGTTGLDCEFSDGSDWPIGQAFTHECYAYPVSTIGTIPTSQDPGAPGPGAPGWVDNPEGSIECQVTAFVD